MDTAGADTAPERAAGAGADGTPTAVACCGDGQDGQQHHQRTAAGAGGRLALGPAPPAGGCPPGGGLRAAAAGAGGCLRAAVDDDAAGWLQAAAGAGCLSGGLQNGVFKSGVQLSIGACNSGVDLNIDAFDLSAPIRVNKSAGSGEASELAADDDDAGSQQRAAGAAAGVAAGTRDPHHLPGSSGTCPASAPAAPGPSAAALVGGAAVARRAPRWAPPPSPEERQRILWAMAREDAEDVAQQASMKFPECIEVRSPLLDITQRALIQRVLNYVPRGEWGSAYVGSTSDPAWRWEGDTCWRCERDVCAPRLLPTHMVDHKVRWKKMTVVAAFSDQETAASEEALLKMLEGHEGLANIATDARGLAIRPTPAYSFIYVCTDGLATA